MDVDGLIDELIEREGGYVNHPADKGGPTCFGITEAVARAHGFAGAMAELPQEEAAAIYRRLYWLRPRFDQVADRAPRVAAELFDTGANMGPAVAATFLQRALTALNRNGKDYGTYIFNLAEFHGIRFGTGRRPNQRGIGGSHHQGDNGLLARRVWWDAKRHTCGNGS